MHSNGINFLAIVDELYSNQFANIHLATGYLSFHDHMFESKVKESWLLPLVKIVKEYIDNGDSLYKKIYIGERLFRPFSPHVSNDYKKAYFDAVLKQDIAIFSRHFGDSVKLVELHDFGICSLLDDEFSLTTLGDCLMSQINSITSILALEKGIGITRHEHYIGAFGLESDFDSNIQIHSNDRTLINIIAISPFSYWGTPGFRLLMKKLWESAIKDDEAYKLADLILDFVKRYVDALEKNTKAIIFLHNSAGLPWLVPNIYLDFYPWNVLGAADSPQMEKLLGKINNNIDAYIRDKQSVFIIDERKIAASISRKQLNAEILTTDILDKSLFHYNFFGFHVADYYMELIERIRHIKSIKVLFVDFDNSLWSGVMAEGKVQHYIDRQNIIRKLHNAGILLVALSKNDERNIRWSEIAIDVDCFCLLKINWNNKVTNVIRACKELNISVDQTMILDDSPQELGLIKSHLPNVKILDSTHDSSWRLLETLCTFAQSRLSGEINRTKVYRDNINRKHYLNKEKIDFSSADNLMDLYSPMNIILTIRPVLHIDLDRVQELLMRTNQFNCSGKIYKSNELRELIDAQDYKIFSFSLKDSFGDMGLIGAVFIRSQVDFVCIENFVLSCRAMGYFVEKSMMTFVLKQFLGKKIKAILTPTEKNIPAQLFYKSTGFIEVNRSEIWEYCAPSQDKLSEVEWINLDIQS